MVARLKKLPFSTRRVLKVVSALASRYGFKIYLVGGVVRDLILGETNLDLDIVVEGDAAALAKRLAEYFKSESRRHHSFGTATVYLKGEKIDFATARKEQYSRWGVLPKVSPSRLKDDLFRRDFTINAMAVSLNKSDYAKVVDLCGGLADLESGLIRVIHEASFLDDPTRILRAIRFEQRFSFGIEKKTKRLMKEALAQNALKYVHPHRLRDELTLLLSEPQPYRCIKRIKELSGFSFMDNKIRLKEDDFRLILRIEKALSFFGKKFKHYRRLNSWLIYLGAILSKISQEKVQHFLSAFDFKKGERIIITSIRKDILRIKKLDERLKPHEVYCVLNPLSFESVVFFYAYHRNRRIRENIELYLDKLVNIRLKVKGSDLEKMGIKPSILYSKLLQKLLYRKMDYGLLTKQQEIEEIKRIFKKLSQLNIAYS